MSCLDIISEVKYKDVIIDIIKLRDSVVTSLEDGMTIGDGDIIGDI